MNMAESSAPAGPAAAGQNAPVHQNSLDGLRAVAALAVLAFHVAGQTGIAFQGTIGGRVSSRADVAVAIFFGLSGLLLYRPWARATLTAEHGPRSAAYLWRRALRILPAYWILVAVALFAYRSDRLGSAETWLRWLTLSQIYDLRPWWELPGPQGLAHIWSLSTEVAFYLLLPLLAAALGAYARFGKGRHVVSVRARRLLIGLALLSLMSPIFNGWIVVTQQNFQLYLWLPRSFWWFAAGMAIAVLGEWAKLEDGPVRKFCQTLAASPGTTWIIAAAAYAAACTDLGGPVIPSSLKIPLWENEARLTLYLIVAFCLIAPAAFQSANETVVSWLLGNGTMRFLGRISYGIFLWQFIAIFAYYDMTDRRPLSFDYLEILVISVIGTVIMATAGYYLVEKPAMRLRGLVPGRGLPGKKPSEIEPAPPPSRVQPTIQWHTLSGDEAQP
jgi:peptidoglycan/LPS O-acetylase OafA/YrhL